MGNQGEAITLSKARRLAIDMIRHVNMQLIDIIPEQESAKERDSQSVAGYDLPNDQAKMANDSAQSQAVGRDCIIIDSGKP